MGRARLSCLLALLLSSAVFDDAWAAATLWEGDNAAAAENDEYPRCAGQPLPQRSRKSDRPAPGAPEAPHRSAPARPAPAPAGVARPAVSGGPSLLYLFMSIRR
jgi:hypothetical protein